MPTYTRANAWNEGGTFSNTDLLWYAKGVGKMQERGLDDPASWWFFAAIHGEYVDPSTPWYPGPTTFPCWAEIQGPPAVPTTPLPSEEFRERFWNQCQHGSWYFLPWHRGYLHALEAQLRADIVSLGGPSTWSLPYWNYVGGPQGSEAAIPPAFTEPTLPDNTTSNPLFVKMRFGPSNDGNIYVPTTAWVEAHGGEPGSDDVTDAVMQDDVFTGTDIKTIAPGFGGPDTGFSHSGSTHGNMERNPHDMVHGYVGGAPSSTIWGLMADPGIAALDPIFYLHHCNIDRMWAAWNAAGNANPVAPDWLNGPAQQFVMPMPGAEPWYYTPQSVQDIASLQYGYENPDTTRAAPPVNPWKTRLLTLGVAGDAADFAEPPRKTPSLPAELLGSSAGALTLPTAARTSVPVALHTAVRAGVEWSFKAASPVQAPDQVLLKLENVRGTNDATVLRIYADLPDQANPQEKHARLVGAVGLFGLRRASLPDGQHAGAGLTFILDMSRIADDLFVENKLSADQVKIDVEPVLGGAPDNTVEIGRISLYRQQF